VIRLQRKLQRPCDTRLMDRSLLAAKAGVSREWINAFEGGKPTVEFGLVIRVLEALGLGLDIVERGAVPKALRAGRSIWTPCWTSTATDD